MLAQFVDSEGAHCGVGAEAAQLSYLRRSRSLNLLALQ